MTALTSLARLLGVRRGLAEDAMLSERGARAALSRRDLFAAAGVMAAGSCFSFARPETAYERIRVFFDGKELATLSRLSVSHGPDEYDVSWLAVDTANPEHKLELVFLRAHPATVRVEHSGRAYESRMHVTKSGMQRDFICTQENATLFGPKFQEVAT